MKARKRETGKVWGVTVSVSPLVTPPPSIWNDGVNYKEYSDM